MIRGYLRNSKKTYLLDVTDEDMQLMLFALASTVDALETADDCKYPPDMLPAIRSICYDMRAIITGDIDPTI